MQVWVEKTGESGGFVNVPAGSTIKDCLDAAKVTYVPGENIFLNGLAVVNGQRVDLNTQVKENDTVQVVPNYSGAQDHTRELNDLCRERRSVICRESLTPSLQ